MISDHDQRVLAALDADVATTRTARLLARTRARCSALALNVATVLLTALAFGLLAAGVEVGSRGLAIVALLLLTTGQTPTLIAFRYTT